MQQEQINFFLEKYAAGNYREEEHQQFIDWLKVAPMEEVEAIAEAYKNIAASNAKAVMANPYHISQIEAALDQYDLGDANKKYVPAKVISFSRYWKVAGAAIIFLLATGSYFVFFNNTSRQAPGDNEVAVTKDIPAPNTTKAYITLADGSKVFLDNVQSGTIATEGNVNVMKSGDGSVAYSSKSGDGSQEIKYNTLTVPKASKPMALMLADGSKVWLDAGTTINYPTSFVGKERKVELITGQSYFEITHDATMPFKVKKGNTEIEVLGTHFNVDAYDDDIAMKVTLLEGSIALSREPGTGSRERRVIKPGEQAQVTNSIKVVNADVNAVMAWKSGLFNFNNSDLQMVLRQLARWYDVDIVYQGAIPKRNFGGEMQRDLNLSEVLKILEKNNVRFKIDGKKLIVLP